MKTIAKAIICAIVVAAPALSFAQTAPATAQPSVLKTVEAKISAAIHDPANDRAITRQSPSLLNNGVNGSRSAFYYGA